MEQKRNGQAGCGGGRCIVMMRYTKQVTIKLWDIKCIGDCRATVRNGQAGCGGGRCIVMMKYTKQVTINYGTLNA